MIIFGIFAQDKLKPSGQSKMFHAYSINWMPRQPPEHRPLEVKNVYTDQEFCQCMLRTYLPFMFKAEIIQPKQQFLTRWYKTTIIVVDYILGGVVRRNYSNQ